MHPESAKPIDIEKGAGEKDTRSMPKNERTTPPGEYQIRHPLRGVILINGKVPGIDVKDDPLSHKRLAIGEITTSEDGKPMRTESGIIKLDIKTFEPEPKERKVAVTSSLPRPKIGETLQKESQNPGMLNVAISIVADETIEGVWHQLQREIGLGNILTKTDLTNERLKIMDKRRVALRVNKVPVIKKLTEMGVKFSVLENLNLINAQLSPTDLKNLALIPEVRSLRTLDRKSADDLAEACPMPSSWLNNRISGTEIFQGTQIKQFLCENYDAQPTAGAYGVAMIESGASYCNYSRYDWKNGPTRWKGAQECGLFTCDPLATCFNGSNGSDFTTHATQTTALLSGDLTQEQSPTYGSNFSLLQAERSGYAPEAEVYRYAMGNFGFGKAVNHVLGLSNPPLATNISWSTTTDFPGHDCIGIRECDVRVGYFRGEICRQ